MSARYMTAYDLIKEFVLLENSKTPGKKFTVPMIHKAVQYSEYSVWKALGKLYNEDVVVYHQGNIGRCSTYYTVHPSVASKCKVQDSDASTDLSSFVSKVEQGLPLLREMIEVVQNWTDDEKKRLSSASQTALTVEQAREIVTRIPLLILEEEVLIRLKRGEKA